MRECDVLIIGAGPVGMALALALRDSGLRLAIADARTRDASSHDPRVLALSHGSRLTLERLGVWPSLSARGAATPIRHIHVSQQHGFGRTRIEAADYGLDALGHVLGAGVLSAALLQALADHPQLEWLEHTRITHLAPGAQDVLASTDQGETLRARLVACAEGGIGNGEQIAERDYDQHALIASVTPAEPHDFLAFERFTAQGPVALLPHGRDYALVHTVPPTEAEALIALDDAAYLARLQALFGSRVRLVATTPRQSWPLKLRYRRNPVGQRTVWLGNAAQTLHPVAGQGFNLALRDVFELARLLGDMSDGDPGDSRLLQRHAEARRLDRRLTIGLTDGLVRLFSQDLPLLAPLRGLGLAALDALPPLRHALAKRMMFGARAWP